MKKIASFVLALVMILSLSTVVFADDTATALKSEASEITLLTKEYEVVGAENLVPAETLTFEVEAAEGNPSDAVITVNEVTVNGTTNNVVVVLPVYEVVGVYNYTITETVGNTQGVTYDDAEIGVAVLVTYNYEENKLDTAVSLTTAGTNGKIDSFTNTYEVGSLKVSKVVTGNLGDQEKKFDVTVTFAAEGDVLSTITYEGGSIAPAAWENGEASVVVSLAHNEFVTFTGIPAGVTYTVEEADYTEDGYTAEYAFSDAAKEIAAEDEDTVEITNDNSATVETGITLDSMPYVVILAIVAGAFVLTGFKKREV